MAVAIIRIEPRLFSGQSWINGATQPRRTEVGNYLVGLVTLDRFMGLGLDSVVVNHILRRSLGLHSRKKPLSGLDFHICSLDWSLSGE